MQPPRARLLAVLLTIACIITLDCAAAARAAPRSLQAAQPRVSSFYKNRLLQTWLTNAELGKWMDEYITRCGNARKFSLGASGRGQQLWALEISDRPGADEAEPYWVYIANMHGDETSGRHMLPLYAEWLCSGAGSDPVAGRILRGMHTVIVPTMNPDGYDSKRRANKDGVDLNRAFPDQFRDAGRNLTAPPPGAAPEVRAVMALFNARPYHGAGNFHEGALVANYPWDSYADWTIGYSTGAASVAPDDRALYRMARAYADAHTTMATQASGEPSFDRGVTNGAQWYPILGGMQDWTYSVAGCPHITLEISKRKSPARTQLPALWAQNRAAMPALALTVLQGARGFVLGNSSTPIQGAALTAVPASGPTGSAQAPEPFYTDRLGFWARPLEPGKSYNVTASAPGYSAKTLTVAVPFDGSGALLNVTLAL